MAFNKNDINTENEAKEYPNYYGGVLKPEEKAIFDSGLLKPNGTLDKTFLQDTAELLNNLKQSKEKVKTATMGLDDDRRALLKSLLVEQKGETIPYQLVNTIGSDKPFDKVISQLEDVFFAENEPEFDRKAEVAGLKLKGLIKKGEEVDKEIKKLEKKYNQQLLDKQTTLETKVTAAVNALKIELKTVGSAGNKILQNIIDSNKDYSKRFYTPTVPSSTTSYGSVIQTGYTNNSKPYAHPAYLLEDLPGQIWTLLKNVDKDKLFDYISSSACAWGANDKKKFKDTFERIRNWNVEFKSGRNSSLMGYFGDSQGSFMFVETRSSHKFDRNDGRITWTKEKVKNKEIIHISDIFYIMHALFPKDSNYQDSPFLKVGENSCLQFSNGDSLDKPYDIYWRGADNGIFTKNYVIDSGNASILGAPFPVEEKKLTWADGKIPEFFWQVYNKDDAVDFSSVYDEILSKDGNTKEKIREEKISVYEKKLNAETSTAFRRFVIRETYKEHVGEFIKNLKDVHGNKIFTEKEAIELKPEWESIAKKIALNAMKTLAKFRDEARGLTFNELKTRAIGFSDSQIKWLNTKIKQDKIDDKTMVDVWNEWEAKTSAKRETLRKAGSNLGEKIIELNSINSKEEEARQELVVAQDLERKAKEGKMKGLKDTFNAINAKTKKSWKEKMFLRSILGLVEEWQNKYPDLYPADPAFDVTTFRQTMDNEEKTLLGILAPYQVWVALGENFTKRLDAWRDTDGKFHSKEYEKIWLTEVKTSLDSAKDKGGLSPEAENELKEIDNYLKGTPVPTDKLILPSDLKAALQTGVNIFSDTTKQWRNYQSSINFKGDAEEIKKIADKVNASDAKIKKPDLIKYLKENVSKKPGLPEFPDDSASEQAKLDWFWSLSPEIVIETIASQELVADSTLKETIIKEMKDAKDGDKVLDSSQYKKNDQGEFSDEAIAKFYYEKLGGQNHSMIKTEDNNKNKKGKGFWSWDNPSAIITGGFLIVGTGLILAGIIWWEKLAAWWDGPADAEGNGDDDEENDE